MMQWRSSPEQQDLAPSQVDDSKAQTPQWSDYLRKEGCFFSYVVRVRSSTQSIRPSSFQKVRRKYQLTSKRIIISTKLLPNPAGFQAATGRKEARSMVRRNLIGQWLCGCGPQCQKLGRSEGEPRYALCSYFVHIFRLVHSTYTTYYILHSILYGVRCKMNTERYKCSTYTQPICLRYTCTRFRVADCTRTGQPKELGAVRFQPGTYSFATAEQHRVPSIKPVRDCTTVHYVRRTKLMNQ